MKTTTLAVIGVAVAAVIAACAVLEDHLARVTTPDFATAAIDAGCTGGREFVEAATAPLDSTAASLIVKGVEAACALRAKRTTISATVYDNPLDSFCASTGPLETAHANPAIRSAFNARRSEVCEARR